MIPEFITPSSTPKRTVSESSITNDSDVPGQLLNDGAFQKALHQETGKSPVQTSSGSADDQSDTSPVDRDKKTIVASGADSETQVASDGDARKSTHQKVTSSGQIRRIDRGESVAAAAKSHVPVADSTALGDSDLRIESVPTVNASDLVSTEPPDPGTLPSLDRRTVEPTYVSREPGETREPAHIKNSGESSPIAPNGDLVLPHVLPSSDVDTIVSGGDVTPAEPALTQISPADTDSVDRDVQLENDDRLSFPTLPSLRPDVTLSAEIAVPPQSIPAVIQQPGGSASPTAVQPVDVQSVPAVVVDTTEPLVLETPPPETGTPDVTYPDSLPPVLPSLSRGVSRKPETSRTQQSQIPAPIHTVLGNSEIASQSLETGRPVGSTAQQADRQASLSTGVEPAGDASVVTEPVKTSPANEPENGKPAAQRFTVEPVVVGSQSENASSVGSPEKASTPISKSRDNTVANSVQPDIAAAPEGDVRDKKSTTESRPAIPGLEAGSGRSNSPAIQTSSLLPGENQPVTTDGHVDDSTSQPIANAVIAKPAGDVVDNNREGNIAAADSDSVADRDSGIPIESQSTAVPEEKSVTDTRSIDAGTTAADSQRSQTLAYKAVANQAANAPSIPDQTTAVPAEASRQTEARVDRSSTAHLPQVAATVERQDAETSGEFDVDRQASRPAPQPVRSQVPTASQAISIEETSDDALTVSIAPPADSGKVNSVANPAESQPAAAVSSVSASAPTATASQTVTSNISQADPAQPAAVPMEIQEAVSAIQDATSGDGHIRVRLNPRELGSMFVDVARTDAGIVARLEVETSAARVAVLETLPDLQQSLSRSGTVVDRVEVVINESRAESGRQDGSQQQQKEQQSRQERQSSGQRQNRDEQNHRREQQHKPDTPPDEISDRKRPDELDIKL